MLRRRRGVCAMEALEDRMLLSATANFSPGSGKLTIQGDSNGNGILIEGTGAEGAVEVYHGGALIGSFTGVKHIRANLGEGNDVLHLSAVEIPGNLTVNMGSGSDTFLTKNTPLVGASPDGDVTIGGNVKVNMGNNNGDYVYLYSDSGDHGTYLKGNVSFRGVADVDMRGDGGSSVVESSDIHFQKNLKITLSQFGDANGDGENLRLRDVNVHGTTQILGSVAEDRMEIYRSQFSKLFKVNARTGDDLVDVHIGGGWNRFNGPITVNGGIGDDTYDQNPANFLSEVETLWGIENVI